MNIINDLGLMNNTKWEEIRDAMLEYPSAVLWRTKDVETGYLCNWDGDWFYHFKIGGYETIEWLEVMFENEEMKEDLLKIFKSIHVPGEVFKETIKIYGYKADGGYSDYI